MTIGKYDGYRLYLISCMDRYSVYSTYTPVPYEAWVVAISVTLGRNVPRTPKCNIVGILLVNVRILLVNVRILLLLIVITNIVLNCPDIILTFK